MSGWVDLLRIRLLGIGKDKDRWVSEGVDHYAKLLSRWASLDLEFLPALKSTSSLTPAQIKKKEAEKLASKLRADTLIALSDSGRRMDSPGFARLLEQVRQRGGTVTFLIGGPYGLDDRLLKKADRVLSLSPLTFSHQVVRLVLLEQLYRGLSILQGTAYHK